MFIDAHNIAPHLETAFELAKRHLDEGDEIDYYFVGNALPYREFMAYSRLEAKLFRRYMPERQAVRLVDHSRLRFVSETDLGVDQYRVPAPRTMDELKSWTYKGADLGMGVASSLISRSGNSEFDPARNSGVVADALAGAAAVYEYSWRVLEREKPDLLYVFNGRICNTRAVLRAAERVGVPVRVHDRGATREKFVVRPFVPHDRVSIQREMQEIWESSPPGRESQAREWFAERRSGQPKDWWSFTEEQKQGLLPDLPSDKRIVTYFSSSDDEFAAIGDMFKWENWSNQMDAVAGLIRVAGKVKDVQLVIRLHPHLMKKHADDRSRWLELSRSGGTAIVVEPESHVDSYALLDMSDVVVTGGSTMGMEAVYWGRPSILLGPSDYDRLGAVHVAAGEADLERLLLQSELPVDPASALSYGYYRGSFGEAFKYYSASTLRTGEFMGVDIQRLPLPARIVNKCKELVLGTIRGTLAVRAHQV